MSTETGLKSLTSGARINVQKTQDRLHRSTNQPKGSTEHPRSDAGMNKHQRPTHCESDLLLVGHHPILQEKMTRFQSSLLEGSVEGLDPSILVKPRRLHFTLGVMSLVPANQLQSKFNSSTSSPKTVESALQLLQSLQPQLTALCAVGREGILQAPLERVGAFESRDGAKVMWVSPREGEGWPETDVELAERQKLVRVAELVHRVFKDAGYITETRPLKLHCTLINTSYRKPYSRRPQLFNFTDVLTSHALLELQASNRDTQATSASVSSALPSNRVARVSLGTYDIPEIQLCAMGSHGPEGEYVSLGSVPLTAAGRSVAI